VQQAYARSTFYSTMCAVIIVQLLWRIITGSRRCFPRHSNVYYDLSTSCIQLSRPVGPERSNAAYRCWYATTKYHSPSCPAVVVYATSLKQSTNIRYGIGFIVWCQCLKV